MNERIGRIGSAIAGASVLCFALCMALAWDFGSYLVCIFLAIGYVLMAAAFRAECRPEDQAAGSAGLAFAAVYAVLVLLVYYAQLTAVRLDGLGEETLGLLDYRRFGLFFSYDLLGYGMMALSTLFTGLSVRPKSRRDRALKGLMTVHGVFFLSCFAAPMLGLFSPGSGKWVGVAVLEGWCAYFLPIAVLSYLHFRENNKHN